MDNRSMDEKTRIGLLLLLGQSDPLLTMVNDMKLVDTNYRNVEQD